jgi:predicted O-linked N-acetylglucosamine transferase (SPINDLY family)
MSGIQYNVIRSKGVIPSDENIYFGNLFVLSLDLSEKDLFDFRFNPEEVQKKYDHLCRYNKPLKKIGFISRDFSENRPSGQLAGEFFSYLKEELAVYDIEIYLYSPRFKVSRTFRSYVTAVREENNIFRLGDRIFEDKIDILVDMQGHMHSNFNNILMTKPAPIIIHWLGYPGTMGLKCIDYHIADRTIIPPESTKYYMEKIAYLDHCYQINNSKLLVDKSTFTREALGYPADKFIFCHFNDNYKLDKETWLVWMEILKQVPNSVLLFSVKSEALKEILVKDAISAGVDVGAQFIYAKWMGRYANINRLATTDCGLDTYFCNGHTTSSDLIAAGTPVLTFPGETYHSRVTKSLLLAIDVPELICDSFSNYIQKAVRLATDREYYLGIREKIKANRSAVLYNSLMYTRNWIQLLHNIWRNHFGTVLPEGVKEMEVGKFGNYKKKGYQWVFYPGKDSPGGDISVVDLRYQELRDYADLIDECIAFNTEGHLKREVVGEEDFVTFGTSNDCGLWVKRVIK